MNKASHGKLLDELWRKLDGMNFSFDGSTDKTPPSRWGLCSLIEADNSAGATNAPKEN